MNNYQYLKGKRLKKIGYLNGRVCEGVMRYYAIDEIPFGSRTTYNNNGYITPMVLFSNYHYRTEERPKTIEVMLQENENYALKPLSEQLCYKHYKVSDSKNYPSYRLFDTYNEQTMPIYYEEEEEEKEIIDYEKIIYRCYNEVSKDMDEEEKRILLGVVKSIIDWA